MRRSRFVWMLVFVVPFAISCGEEAGAGDGGGDDNDTGVSGDTYNPGPDGGMDARADAGGDTTADSGGGDTSGGDGSGCFEDGPPTEHEQNISETATWSGSHLVKGELRITGSLTIEKGATIYMAPDSLLSVQGQGSLQSTGTSSDPVTFTSSRCSPSPGDWERIEIYSDANNDVKFEHTTFEYGSKRAEWGMLWAETDATLDLSNVTFRKSSGRAMYFEKGVKLQTFEGVTLEEIADGPIWIGANDVHVLGDLTVNGDMPPIQVAGATIADDQTWKKLPLPYELVSNIEVEAELEIAAGTEVQIGPGLAPNVQNGGAIRALGESGNRVTIRSSKDSPAPGDWDQFNIYKEAGNNNLLQYTTVKHGGGDEYGAIWVEDEASLTLDHVEFVDNDGCDIEDLGTVQTTMTNYSSCQ